MINIYCLIDPRTNLPFYVGATKSCLKKRLYNHLSIIHIPGKYGVMAARRDLIKNIVAEELKPEIKLLKQVLPHEVDFYENYFYSYYTDRGIELLQSKWLFNYQLKKLNKI